MFILGGGDMNGWTEGRRTVTTYVLYGVRTVDCGHGSLHSLSVLGTYSGYSLGTLWVLSGYSLGAYSGEYLGIPLSPDAALTLPLLCPVCLAVGFLPGQTLRDVPGHGGMPVWLGKQKLKTVGPTQVGRCASGSRARHQTEMRLPTFPLRVNHRQALDWIREPAHPRAANETRPLLIPLTWLLTGLSGETRFGLSAEAEEADPT